MAVILGVTFQAHAYSETYRWADEAGRVFYSDRRPTSKAEIESVGAESSQENAIRLNVPLVKQGKGLCGPATIEMLLRYWGEDRYDQYDIAYGILNEFKNSKRVLKSKILESNPIDWELYPGTEAGTMRDFLKLFASVENPKLEKISGSQYEAMKERDKLFENLKQNVRRGVPVIVHQYWREVGSNGHYRIVIGFDERRREVYLNDSTHGKMVKQSYELFLELWNVNEPWLHYNAIVFNGNKAMIKLHLKHFEGQRPSGRK